MPLKPPKTYHEKKWGQDSPSTIYYVSDIPEQDLSKTIRPIEEFYTKKGKK